MCPFLKLKTCTFFLSFHVILKFSFDFPLYLPITLVILDDLDTYAALSAWRDASLLPEGGTRWRQPYIFYTVWRELRNEDDQVEKADWWQNQTRLTHCSRCHWTWMWTSTVPSWSVALHAARLYYYSIQIIWLDFLSHYPRIILFSSSAYYPKEYYRIMCGSLMKP